MEADSLTNEDFSAFSLENRVGVSWPCERFTVLSSFLEAGKALFDEVAELRSEAKLTGRKAARSTRKPKVLGLKSTDPW